MPNEELDIINVIRTSSFDFTECYAVEIEIENVIHHRGILEEVALAFAIDEQKGVLGAFYHDILTGKACQIRVTVVVSNLKGIVLVDELYACG